MAIKKHVEVGGSFLRCSFDVECGLQLCCVVPVMLRHVVGACLSSIFLLRVFWIVACHRYGTGINPAASAMEDRRPFDE